MNLWIEGGGRGGASLVRNLALFEKKKPKYNFLFKTSICIEMVLELFQLWNRWRLPATTSSFPPSPTFRELAVQFSRLRTSVLVVLGSVNFSCQLACKIRRHRNLGSDFLLQQPSGKLRKTVMNPPHWRKGQFNSEIEMVLSLVFVFLKKYDAYVED